MTYTTDIWGAGFSTQLVNAKESPRNIQKVETGTKVLTLRHCTYHDGTRSGGAVVRMHGKGFDCGHRPHFPVIERRLRVGWDVYTLGRYLTVMRQEFEQECELWKQRESLFKHLESRVLPDELPCDGHSDVYADMTFEDIRHWWKVSKDWAPKAL